jgi:UDP-2,3-diacylglucosamine hydrolase
MGMRQKAVQVQRWVGDALASRQASRQAVFVSDSHLGAAIGEPGRESSLCAMLASLSEEVQDLILGGDTFEFWFEWRHVQPRLGRILLDELERQAAFRRVWMIRGNHDFALGTAIRERGIRVLDDGLCLEIGGKTWLFLHGDGMVPEDRMDRWVRRLLRSCWAQWAYRNLLHPDWAMALALGTGRASRAANPGPSANIDAYEATAFAWMKATGIDGVVHGHTHRPLRRVREGRTYVNNGDWCRTCSCVRVDARDAFLEMHS